MNKSDLLANRVFCYFFRNCSSVASSSSGKTVHTTGYSYKHRDGRFVGKYGIYFDAGDKRNKLEEIYGKEMTHVAAKIYAIIEAIKLSEKNTDLTVKTDYKIESLELLKKYAKHDFRRYYFPYDRVTNADLLQELHELIEERQQRIDLVYSAPELGEKNPVTELILKDMYKTFKPYYPNVDLPPEQSELINDLSSPWPTVYTSGILTTSSKGFTSAGYSTLWPENEVLEVTHQRLAMIPVTLFRAELSAIILALEQAEKHGLKKVLVVTDSPYFLKHWKTGWKTIKGEDISNKYLYNRIYDLVYNRRMTVRFRYEKPNESSIWTTLRQRCEKALMMPLSPANTSYYDKTPDEITTIRCPLIDAGEEVCRVRYFKKGTRYKNGLLWDKINSTEEAKFMTTSSGKIVDVILAILRHAVEENNDVIVIRTDSIQFLKKIESWMPVWKRSGWRNSRQGQIFDWEKWQEADRLLAQVKIYWELMDPPSSEDIADVEKFAPKKRRGRNKTTEENIEAKEEVQEMEDILNDEDDSGNVAIAARI